MHITMSTWVYITTESTFKNKLTDQIFHLIRIRSKDFKADDKPNELDFRRIHKNVFRDKLVLVADINIPTDNSFNQLRTFGAVILPPTPTMREDLKDLKGVTLNHDGNLISVNNHDSIVKYLLSGFYRGTDELLFNVKDAPEDYLAKLRDTDAVKEVVGNLNELVDRSYTHQCLKQAEKNSYYRERLYVTEITLDGQVYMPRIKETRYICPDGTRELSLHIGLGGSPFEGTARRLHEPGIDVLCGTELNFKVTLVGIKTPTIQEILSKSPVFEKMLLEHIRLYQN